jgi:hypothetical protein
MSMTRDSYAKEVLRVAEAALHQNQAVICPHEGCEERLSIVRQGMLSTRSIFCPVHGHIFQEQRVEPFSKLDWDEAAARQAEAEEEEDWEHQGLFDTEYEAYDDSENPVA